MSAERVAAELLDRRSRRIHVNGLADHGSFISRLCSLMPETRFITFQFSMNEPYREGLREYFIGEGLPDPSTAFQAGWRSHLTEMALAGRGKGLEAAAGLGSLREPLRGYLTGSGAPEPSGMARLLSSFSLVLPTVFILLDCREYPPPGLPDGSAPPLVALSRGHWTMPGADLAVWSDTLPESTVKEAILRSDSAADLDLVMEATGGRAGLVELYLGLAGMAGVTGPSVFEMLSSVLDSDSELELFAAAAASMGCFFIPGEAAAASGVSPDKFLQGKAMGLWKGFMVGAFLSVEVADFILNRLGELERRRLMLSCADAILSSSASGSVPLARCGVLYTRLGMPEEARRCFMEAAAKERSELRRAGFYRRAAESGENGSEEALFMESVCLYREKLAPRPEHVPLGIRREDFMELSPELSAGVKAFRRGKTVPLADFASRGEECLPLALAAIGEELMGSGCTDGGMNASRAAASLARDLSISWLETEALLCFCRGCNRTGRFGELEKALGRLLELVLASGNGGRLVAVYNIFANSLLLRTRYQDALRVYSASLRTLGHEGDPLRSVILNNMGVAQRRLFLTDDALETMMRFVRASVSQGCLAQAATAYGNMARLFIDLSSFDAAGDCLQTMLEFRSMAGLPGEDDSVLFIASQIAFHEGDTDAAIELMERAIEISRISGGLRRVSLNLLKKGSMLLTSGRLSEALPVLEDAVEASIGSRSMLNAFVARVKLAAVRCLMGEDEPWKLLAIQVTGNPDDTHRGEQYYYHWKVSGSPQSMTAAACLLGRGLAPGLHRHFYMPMLKEIAENAPGRLAEELSLVHNYPSPDTVKGDRW